MLNISFLIDYNSYLNLERFSNLPLMEVCLGK